MDSAGMARFRRWYNQYMATHGVPPSQDLVTSYLEGELEAEVSARNEAESLRLQEESLQLQREYQDYRISESERAWEAEQEAAEMAAYGQMAQGISDLDIFDYEDDGAGSNLIGGWEWSSAKKYGSNILQGGLTGLATGPPNIPIGMTFAFGATFLGDIWNNVADTLFPEPASKGVAGLGGAGSIKEGVELSYDPILDPGLDLEFDLDDYGDTTNLYDSSSDVYDSSSDVGEYDYPSDIEW